ncbi:NAD(P)-dependent oxidoreductase [Pseudarthrobacter sp. DSP2-3-2b1]|uniref:NAD(P)-dependent oxidoreductase n=1 Tax=Pseudarthrobacter sp. DSP2-3-2b1 TaxID=2804661 RepID=UPI003CEEBE6D
MTIVHAGQGTLTAPGVSTAGQGPASTFRRPKALLAMSPPQLADMVFGEGWQGLRECVELVEDTVVTDLEIVDAGILERLEVLVTGWGSPVLSKLPDGATVINTSRGELIDQEALLTELRTGRIRAILDVTVPDLLPTGHELFHLPNVLLTPRIAGSMGGELARLGQHVLAELLRYRRDRSFAYPEANRSTS